MATLFKAIYLTALYTLCADDCARDSVNLDRRSWYTQIYLPEPQDWKE